MRGTAVIIKFVSPCATLFAADFKERILENIHL